MTTESRNDKPPLISQTWRDEILTKINRVTNPDRVEEEKKHLCLYVADPFIKFCGSKFGLTKENLKSLAKNDGDLEKLIRLVNEYTSRKTLRIAAIPLLTAIPIIGWLWLIVYLPTIDDKGSRAWTYDSQRRKLEKQGKGNLILEAIREELNRS